ncbi:hypothetical protein ACEPPN_019424 [Leptodophora sp. 'Broadleaf-Isolate-01']
MKSRSVPAAYDNQDANVDLASVLKSKKRKPCQLDGSQDRPITIDDPESAERGLKRRQFGQQQRRQHTKGPIRVPIPVNIIRVRELLRSSRKVVVISGAGISANAGFSTFQQMRKSERVSFDRSLYSLPVEAAKFHSTICSMFARTQSDACQPTPFHKTMATLAQKHKLTLHIAQNIDCVEQRLPDLEAKTVRLHGRVDQMRCQKCNWVGAFQPRLFQGADLPSCSRCVERYQARVSQGKRIPNPGELRPDVLLYNEPHPDDTGIWQTIQRGLRKRPDLVLIVGTTLKVPGALSIATNFCRATQSRGGVAIWMSKEEPLSKVRHLFDYVFRGDCDDLACKHLHYPTSQASTYVAR